MQVLTRRDPRVELRRVRELLRHRVAGLLLVPTFDPHETLELIHASGTPAVLVDRPSGDPRFDEVTFDNREVMRDAVGQADPDLGIAGFCSSSSPSGSASRAFGSKRCANAQPPRGLRSRRTCSKSATTREIMRGV